MKLGGPVENLCAGRLLSAAAIVDMMFVALVTTQIAPQVQGRIPIAPPEAVPIVLYLLTLALFWIISEGFLNGFSLGRAALGLSMRRTNGYPISIFHRWGRVLRKISVMGMTGVNPNLPGRYDRVTGVVWYAPIAPRKRKPVAQWKLQIESGQNKGRSTVLAQVPGFGATRTLKIGRDPKWCNVLLPNDAKVSAQHCRLTLRDSELWLQDWGRDGMGSSNGTRLNGRKLKPGQWEQIGSSDLFSVADVLIRIIR